MNSANLSGSFSTNSVEFCFIQTLPSGIFRSLATPHKAEPNVDRKNLLSLFNFDRVDLGVVLNRDKL